MIKELFFLNEPVEFKTDIFIYPPSVKDVITNKNFGLYNQILTYSQEEIEDNFMAEGQNLKEYPTPFEFLLNNSYHDKNYEQYAMKAFELFTHQKVSFLYEAKMIVFGEIEDILKNIKTLEELVVLKEEEFFDFQNLVRQSIGSKPVARHTDWERSMSKTYCHSELVSESVVICFFCGQMRNKFSMTRRCSA